MSNTCATRVQHGTASWILHWICILVLDFITTYCSSVVVHWCLLNWSWAICNILVSVESNLHLWYHSNRYSKNIVVLLVTFAISFEFSPLKSLKIFILLTWQPRVYINYCDVVLLQYLVLRCKPFSIAWSEVWISSTKLWSIIATAYWLLTLSTYLHLEYKLRRIHISDFHKGSIRFLFFCLGTLGHWFNLLSSDCTLYTIVWFHMCFQCNYGTWKSNCYFGKLLANHKHCRKWKS